MQIEYFFCLECICIRFWNNPLLSKRILKKKNSQKIQMNIPKIEYLQLRLEESVLQYNYLSFLKIDVENLACL